MTRLTRFQARRGDLVVIAGHHFGEPQRIGEILDVLGAGNHFRVRWEDGRESIFYPGSDATIRRAATDLGEDPEGGGDVGEDVSPGD